MKYNIFDSGNGILIEFDFETGMSLSVNMTDESAQQMIDIIQNKLNARLK